MPLIQNILDAIGNTNLIEIEPGIFAKCEFENPSGSIKARMARYLVEQAEADGRLKPGYTIVEATSGNTGNALSMIAAVRGYKMIVLIPEGYSSERVKISRAFGADVRFVGNFHVNHARDMAIDMGKQEGFFCPQQFDNEGNVDENRDWLGREIIAQLPPAIKIDAIVQGVGTGGTLIGVAQALRQWHNPGLKTYAMEPTESRTLECCLISEHEIEGISDGFVPTIYERHKAEITGVVNVKSRDAIDEAAKLTREKGVFVGPSSGGNLWAARLLKERDPSIKNVLTFFCDRGEKYLSNMA